MFRKNIKLSLGVVSFSLRFQHLTVQRNSSEVCNPCVTCVVMQMEQLLPSLTSPSLLGGTEE